MVQVKETFAAAFERKLRERLPADEVKKEMEYVSAFAAHFKEKVGRLPTRTDFKNFLVAQRDAHEKPHA